MAAGAHPRGRYLHLLHDVNCHRIPYSENVTPPTDQIAQALIFNSLLSYGKCHIQFNPFVYVQCRFNFFSTHVEVGY